MHDLRLALHSLRRNPILTALMVIAIAAGIAASMITITLYHSRSGHPIWWKADKLYAVTLDIRDEDNGSNAFANLIRHPEYPPLQVTYQDAKTIYQSDIPTRAVRMFRSSRVIAPRKAGDKPFAVDTRVTTADFFAMFDVPFLYGGGWSRADDEAPTPVVVLSKYANQKLFGGTNSVGKTLTIGDQQFRVVGVIDAWNPAPRFYDLNGNGFDLPENLFMPFGWTEALKLPSNGNSNCVRANTKINTFEELLTSECVWLQYWAELPTASQRQRYQAFVDSYAKDQKRYGRFPRKLNNRIVDVDEWMKMYEVVGDETKIQVAVALMFLLVCVLNTFGLMLAKFLKAAPISGLRRALGASRMDVMRQHLIEVVIVGLLGGALGLMLASGGLRALAAVFTRPTPGQDDNPARVALMQSLMSMDFKMFLVALALALLTGVLAGLYPAWRIGRLSPSLFLKTQ
ncbi:MAG: ABC transporter permease [Gammaproteobacteria bacterium]